MIRLSGVISRGGVGLCRSSLTFTQRNVFIQTAPVVTCSQLSLPVLQRPLHTDCKRSGWFTPKDNVTFMGRLLYRIGFKKMPKSLMKQIGHLIYMKVADEMDYEKFFKYCNLPDTYASWFVVLELHVWLLCARIMQAGPEGRVIRNSLIHAMWEDNNLKSKKLEGALASARRKDLKLLHEQNIAATFSYDEGLLADDHVLAGALWRRIMWPHTSTVPTIFRPEQLQPDAHEQLAKDAKALEMLVIYVRTQYYMLNNLSEEQLFIKRAIKFAPFDDSLFEVARKMEALSSSPNAEMKRLVSQQR